MRQRATTLGTRVAEATAWFQPELLAIPPDLLAGMVKSTEGLSLYGQHLDNLVRTRDHVKSGEVEQLLAGAQEVTGSFSDVFTAYHNADAVYGSMKDEDGNEVELTKARYGRFMESKDRRVREEAWRLFYQAYEKTAQTLAANMAGNVKAHVYYARARNYGSAMEAAVDRNAIPPEVYRNLIDTVSENLGPLHRYAQMRKRLLGVDTLEVWDMSAPLVESPEREYTFEKALEMVSEGLEPLGPEYLTPFNRAFEEGWMDVFENEGKRGGAYSWGTYGTKPYLLMNYNGTLDDVFTFAHEMGHSMHSYLSWRSQPLVYGDYPIFVAEVASTTNEALMIEKMLAETTDRQERLVLLNHYLEQIRGTFFTQVLFAEVELRMHEMQEAGEPLTEDSLDAMYLEVYGKYFGPALHVVDQNGATWSRIPHFYYDFYVYQYATSYAAATALARKILEEGEPAVAGYLEFLKAGSSGYPIDLLRKAGVDMTRPEPVLSTIRVFESLLDRMEDQLGSRKRHGEDVSRHPGGGRAHPRGEPGLRRPRAGLGSAPGALGLLRADAVGPALLPPPGLRPPRALRPPGAGGEGPPPGSDPGRRPEPAPGAGRGNGGPDPASRAPGPRGLVPAAGSDAEDARSAPDAGPPRREPGASGEPRRGVREPHRQGHGGAGAGRGRVRAGALPDRGGLRARGRGGVAPAPRVGSTSRSTRASGSSSGSAR
jgi:oligoendopeptidase F